MTPVLGKAGRRAAALVGLLALLALLAPTAAAGGADACIEGPLGPICADPPVEFLVGATLGLVEDVLRIIFVVLPLGA